MSLLPSIDSPVYTLELPVSKQTIKFRPYVVKEKKLLLMATESDDKNSLIDTIAQIVGNCVLSPINTKELPITDVEFIFYNLRARSESEIVELKYRCENYVNGEMCGNVMHHGLNLLDNLQISDPLPSTIKLDEKLGIKLKHQKFEIDTIQNKDLPTPQELFELIAKNIELIYDDKSTFNTSEIPINKLIDWLGNLSIEQYAKIEEFYFNEPKIHKEIIITCKKCGTIHNIDVEDIIDFFI
jgi:hypothetical protein